MYNKAQVEAAGDALLAAIEAVRDGLDVTDVTAAVSLLTAIGGAADEFRTDTDAAVLHLVSHVAGKLGDARVDAGDPA